MIYSNISILKNRIISKIDQGESLLVFHMEDGAVYHMFHQQACCEHVTIEDISGDLDDLIGEPIRMAETSISNENPKSDYDDSWKWTFYRLATVKGYVTIRWYGSSNGYYGESVDFIQIKPPMEKN